MLILSRKLNESIVIDGKITVKVLRIEGDIVKLGIDAPHTVPVHRKELYLEIQKNNREAATIKHPVLPRLPQHSKPDAEPDPAPQPFASTVS